MKNTLILKRIEDKLVVLKKARPFPPYLINKLREQFSIEMNYNSNAIEGNTLTLRETMLVLQQGITIKGKSLKDHLEVKNQAKAIIATSFAIVDLEFPIWNAPYGAPLIP